jgi:protoporphyrinogen/coproporphyrinogen III oxidase
LGDFVRRRLGEEALNKLAEPLLSGIYNADVEEQSLLATFPRFRDLEVKHGSLIRGMLAAKQMRRQAVK